MRPEDPVGELSAIPVLAALAVRSYPAEVANVVLVHGGAHGAWCWDRLIPFLRADARVERVWATDLCGHGRRSDAKPLEQIGLRDYHESLLEDLERENLRDVVLVGHSLAGITIPAVACLAPDRIRRLIYLTTTNPRRGSSVGESMADPRSPVSRGIDVEEAFCSDLDEQTAAWLTNQLGPQPAGPMLEPIQVVSGPAGIPQTYIVCEEDQVLPVDYQLEQADTIGVDEVVRFASGHSAFASRPRALASLLLGYC